jgi:glutathione synthase/RimK-type ligase-like ATP-grasp enzyme
VIGEIDAFLRGVCATSRWFWVNPPGQVQIAENKLRQLASASALGFAIPVTLVTNDVMEARKFLRRFPLAVAKSIGRSAIELDGAHWAVFTRPLSRASVIGERALRISPCIFQEMIPKRADIRVTVVGSKIFAAAITCRDAQPPEVDWRALESRSLIYRRHSLPREIQDRCHLLMQELGLVYGCFDFILTPEGKYYFLEINPSGQWGWIEHELGFEITDEIARLLIHGKN